MKLEDLINKLREEKHNGRYVILEMNYESLKDYAQRRDEAETGSIKREIARENMQKCFHLLNGFLWGLCAVDYITNMERSDIRDELLEETR